MSLEPGQLLAHDRIDRKIGEGGMGEVYLASQIAADLGVATILEGSVRHAGDCGGAPVPRAGFP